MNKNKLLEKEKRLALEMRNNLKRRKKQALERFNKNEAKSSNDKKTIKRINK